MLTDIVHYKRAPSGAVCMEPAFAAISANFMRIYKHFLDDGSTRFKDQEPFRLLLGPLIERIGARDRVGRAVSRPASPRA